MSLVNDMLRDLEQRKASHQTPAGVQPVAAVAAPVVKRRAGLLAVVAIPVLAGLSYWGWQIYTQAQQAPVPATAVVDNALLPDVRVSEAAPGLPVLRQAGWQIHDQEVRLVLQLPEQGQAEIEQQNESQLVLLLRGASFDRPLPVAGHPLIRGVSLNRVENGAQVTIKTQQAAQFDLVRVNAGQVYLAITPQVMISPAPEPAAQTPAAAKPASANNSAAESNPEAQIQKAAETQALVEVSAPRQPAEKPVRSQPAIKQTPRAPDEKAVVHQARQLLQQGQVQAARQQLQSLLARQPQAVKARSLLAGILLTQADYPAAQQVLDEGLRLTPQALALRKLAARLALAQQQPGQAVAQLQAQPAVLSQDPEYHALLASAQYQAGDYAAAAQTYLQLLEHNARQPQWWLGLGLALEQQGRTVQAARAYQSLARLPVASEAQRNYARQRLAQISSGG